MGHIHSSSCAQTVVHSGPNVGYLSATAGCRLCVCMRNVHLCPHRRPIRNSWTLSCFHPYLLVCILFYFFRALLHFLARYSHHGGSEPMLLNSTNTGLCFYSSFSVSSNFACWLYCWFRKSNQYPLTLSACPNKPTSISGCYQLCHTRLISVPPHRVPDSHYGPTDSVQQ